MANKEKLILYVANQIVKDVDEQDFTAIIELLKFVPVENLIEYLPEIQWKMFEELRKGKE